MARRNARPSRTTRTVDHGRNARADHPEGRSDGRGWGLAIILVLVVAALFLVGWAADWTDGPETADTQGNEFNTVADRQDVPLDRIDLQTEVDRMSEGDEIILEHDDGRVWVERSWI